MSASPRLHRTLLAGAFFLSGAAALGHEMVWSRLLELVFGCTTLALTVITSVFMAGLALGAFLAGRRADRSAHPIRVYALLELGVAAFALAFPVLVRVFADQLHHLIPTEATAPMAASLIRFGAGFVLLLPATAALGATLPFLARQYVRSIHNVGKDLAVLYGINTIGGAVGCWYVGTRVIMWSGLWSAVGLAVGLSLAAAALAMVAARGMTASDPEPAPPSPRETPSEPLPRRGVLLALVFASGLSFLAYEILWFRLLRLYNPASALEGFTIILAACLVGLAAGSLLFPLLQHRLTGLRGVAWLQLAPAMLGFMPYLCLSWVPEHTHIGVGLVLSYASIMAVSVAYGMLFPLFNSLGARDFDKLGATVGEVYCSLTLGNILGAFLATFLLLPLVGLHGGLAACALLNAVIALCAALVAGRRPRLLVSTVAAAALVGVLVTVAPRQPHIPTQPGERLLWYRDGLSASSAVIEREDNGERFLLTGILYSRVRPASIRLDIPFMIHPDPQNVLLVGFGTGVNANEALGLSDTVSVTAVEIDGNQTESSAFFLHDNDALLQHPRFTFVNDDGRSFLQASEPRWDIIAVDANVHYGSYDLYTREFMQLAYDRLRDGGVLSHRLAVAQLPENTRQAIVSTFLSVFPQASLWQVGGDVRLLMGTKGRFAIDLEGITDRQDRGALLGVDPIDLRWRFLAGPAELADGPANVKLITDFQPRYSRPKLHPDEAEILGPLLRTQPDDVPPGQLHKLDQPMDPGPYLVTPNTP